MLTAMPEKKKKPTNKKLKNPNLVFIRMDAETQEAFERFIEDQTVAPERPAVALAALRNFLADRGYLKSPLKSAKPPT